MAEYYPVQRSNAIEQGALEAASSHWRTYYETPEPFRLGDEHTWDYIVTDAIVDIGISRDQASGLNEIAKLNAQFDNWHS